MRTRPSRLRMFAGPNGSGKSTIKTAVPAKLRGVYINPDDIEKSMHQKGFFDTSRFTVKTVDHEIIGFFRAHPLLHNENLSACIDGMTFQDGKLIFGDIVPNSYFAAVAADFLRQKLIEKKTSFSFETVMSSRSKVDQLKQARKAGYRTYLYYIATQDPDINVLRVKNRVQQGGHDVSEAKIRARYDRSLDLLWDAIQHTNRAYIFDNSETRDDPEGLWLAEITEGKDLNSKLTNCPRGSKRPFWTKLLFPYRWKLSAILAKRSELQVRSNRSRPRSISVMSAVALKIRMATRSQHGGPTLKPRLQSFKRSHSKAAENIMHARKAGGGQN